MARKPNSETWRLDHVDKFGRALTLTREDADEFTLRIEPSSQRDEGETIRHLNRMIILELAEILR